MKNRSALAVLLMICLMLSCLPVTVLATGQALTLDQSHMVTIPANGGEYLEKKIEFTFTAPEKGSYALAVSYDEGLSLSHEVYMSAKTAAGEKSALDRVVFQAEAGETCTLTAVCSGLYDTDVQYAFRVVECKTLESVKLEYESDVGFVGDTMFIALAYQPEFYVPEEIACSTTNPGVVEISYYDETWLELNLLSAGTATVTVTTASGKTDSLKITVVDKAVLNPGEINNLEVPGNGGYVMFYFTPNRDGCYVISCDHGQAEYWLEAYDYYYDYENDTYIYLLKAGETYLGYVYNWGEQDLVCGLGMESVEVQIPVAIEITKNPSNTTFLRDMQSFLQLPNQVLTGMEMRVSWSDGSKTTWRFNEHGPYLGYNSVEWTIKENAQTGVAMLVVSCGTLSVSCRVTLLDVSIKSVNVDETPFQLSETDKVYDEKSGTWLYHCEGGLERQVILHFSDGSSVIAKPGDMVYGIPVVYAESQLITPWETGGENLVVYSYGDMYKAVAVEIADAPAQQDPTVPTEPVVPTEPTEGTEPSGGGYEGELNPPTGEAAAPAVLLMLLVVVTAGMIISRGKMFDY